MIANHYLLKQFLREKYLGPLSCEEWTQRWEVYVQHGTDKTFLSATVKMDKPWKPMGEWQWYFDCSDWLQDWVYQGCYVVSNYMQFTES